MLVLIKVLLVPITVVLGDEASCLGLDTTAIVDCNAVVSIASVAEV